MHSKLARDKLSSSARGTLCDAQASDDVYHVCIVLVYCVSYRVSYGVCSSSPSLPRRRKLARPFSFDRVMSSDVIACAGSTATHSNIQLKLSHGKGEFKELLFSKYKTVSNKSVIVCPCLKACKDFIGR